MNDSKNVVSSSMEETDRFSEGGVSGSFVTGGVTWSLFFVLDMLPRKAADDSHFSFFVSSSVALVPLAKQDANCDVIHI